MPVETELPASDALREQGALKKGRLPLWKVVGLGLAAMQVGPIFALAAGYISPSAGIGTWLSMLIAICLTFSVAAPIIMFAQRYVVTGSLISYVGHVLPNGAMLLTAASLCAGYILTMGSLVSGAVIFASSALIDMGAITRADSVLQSGLSVACALFGSFFAYRGIDASVRIALVLGTVSLPALALIGIALLWRHPIPIASLLSLKHVAIVDISRGVWLGLGFYIGFDGLTSLAAETEDPLRNTPRVVFWSLLGAAAIGLVGCVIETPFLLQASEAMAAGTSPAAIIADAGGVGWMKMPVDLLMVCASLASLVGYMNFGSRVLATTAADGLLPSCLAVIHTRFQSPARAVIVLAFVGGALPVILLASTALSPIEASTYLTNMAAYEWVIPYMLICVAALVLQQREGRYHIVVLVPAVVAFIAFGYVALDALFSPADQLAKRVCYSAFGFSAVLAAYFAVCRSPRREVTPSG
jgi:amino acid transporter